MRVCLCVCVTVRRSAGPQRHKILWQCDSEHSRAAAVYRIKTAVQHATFTARTHHVAYASTTSGVSHSCSIISKSAPVTTEAAFSVSSAANADDDDDDPYPYGRNNDDDDATKASDGAATSAIKSTVSVVPLVVRFRRVAVIVFLVTLC